jgi:hypothetical protein
MNLKTTLVLAILVVAGGMSWLLLALIGSHSGTSQTHYVLEQELQPDRITSIEITGPSERGTNHVILTRNGPNWVLPGDWPVREPEVAQLVRTLTTLRSRFEPDYLGDPPDLKQFGLDKTQKPLQVTVKSGDTVYKLSFGEGQKDRKSQGESNRFSRPTYVRLGERSEVVRLAPGLVTMLNYGDEHYMQRRLFPPERVAKDEDSTEKVEQVVAKRIEFKGAGTDFVLQHAKDGWELEQPDHDRVDPDKLRDILTALPDVWAEHFFERKGKDWAEYGLKDKEAEQTVRVTGPGVKKILYIGKVSPNKGKRVIQRPPPPFPTAEPPPPEIVTEEYRYARLDGNDQLFDVKADNLKKVAVALNDLRDPQLARFRADDVKRLEINEGGRQLVFVKEKDKEQWRLEKPALEAENIKVRELLDKLSGLQARGDEVKTKADPKEYGLDGKPATVKVIAEETKGTTTKKTTTKEFTFVLGKHETDKKKLYVQVAPWPRVNVVEDDVLKLAQRPALAYRNRQVLDFAASDLAKIEVQRGGETFTLEQDKGTWRLTAPVKAEVDLAKAFQLAGELSRLEVVEFVAEKATPEQLEKDYGLEKPSVKATVTFSEAKKAAPKTLLLGKQRAGKQEYFARLESDPAIFVVKKETHEALDRSSLAYRPLQLWQLRPEDIAEIRVRKGTLEYLLKREGSTWKLSGQFDAVAATNQVMAITQQLASPHAERYEAHTVKDPKEYGLDAPTLRLTIKPAAKKEGGSEATKEQRLIIGKETKDGKSRFAQLGEGGGVFVLSEKVIGAVDRSDLELLDLKLLRLERKNIQRIRSPEGKFTLQREKNEWRVTDSPAPAFVADPPEVEVALWVWSNLRAQKFVAYVNKIKLADYGLEKPIATITVTVQEQAEKDKPAKTIEHTIALGNEVKESKGDRYAQLDKGPGIIVLDAFLVHELKRTYLDFVDHKLLKFDAAKVTALLRSGEDQTLEIAKRDGDWRVIKPAEAPADKAIMEGLVNELSLLRASRIAAYPAKDQPEFGLDKPAAVVTLRLLDEKGKAIEHVVQIGEVDKKSAEGERFARVDKIDAVVVLPKHLSQQLLAAPLKFRDRTVAKLPAPDKVILERGTRKATFVRDLGTWKLAEPVEVDAEQNELEEFVKALAVLRADELVAEKPADLKAYGLEKPRARWRFLEDKKELLTLDIGDTEKGPPGRVYARLDKGDLVFLLDPKQTSQVLAEYRSRTVWPKFDVVQVERVSYGYAKDPFVLQKVDNTWQVVGKPEVKVDVEKVRDTLDALDRLKAERYVVDKGASLKEFGFEPPELALEIETKTGKHKLLLGRKEGDTQRYYVTVAGAPDTPVFVMSAADEARIVRSLQAFTSGKP